MKTILFLLLTAKPNIKNNGLLSFLVLPQYILHLGSLPSGTGKRFTLGTKTDIIDKESKKERGKNVRILFIGDIVGSLGREAISEYLPKLKKAYHPQVTIANGENAASGRGITEKIYKKLLQDGVDVVTLGNHTWDNRDIFEFIGDAKKMIRPANFSDETPGKGMVFVKVNQLELAVINLQARTFMTAIDDPFKKADELVAQARKKTPFIFVDFHGETTSEKQALSWYLDGRVSAVVGTHTHVQTNDARILPQGTAYLTDVGMTGPYDAILGMKKEPIIEKFKTALPKRFEVVEEGRTILSACLIEIDDQTGKAKRIEPIQISEDRPFRD